MPPDSDPASKQFGAWARARAGVRADDPSTKSSEGELTHEEQVASAVAGGADGGAGRDDDRGERERDPNQVLREAVGIRRMRREL
jgi:hypothetical protein